MKLLILIWNLQQGDRRSVRVIWLELLLWEKLGYNLTKILSEILTKHSLMIHLSIFTLTHTCKETSLIHHISKEKYQNNLFNSITQYHISNCQLFSSNWISTMWMQYHRLKISIIWCWILQMHRCFLIWPNYPKKIDLILVILIIQYQSRYFQMMLRDSEIKLPRWREVWKQLSLLDLFWILLEIGHFGYL